MSQVFRALLKKVGSGSHTTKNLTREEAKLATRMMLLEEATPAQIGAFMIAHRIKRPTPEELAGMWDAYDELGAQLSTDNSPSDFGVTILGNPYDGRARTAPVGTITALILATAGVRVIMHGGDVMPTKYGVTFGEIWQGLGVGFTGLSVAEAESVLTDTGLTFVYLPKHFPLAHQLVPYRDQIGKRPPFATLELMWCPYLGKFHLVSGFVHPPTEERFRATFELKGITDYTTVKGLEGSCDLPRSRTCIIGVGKTEVEGGSSFKRLHLRPSDYGLAGKDIPLNSKPELISQLENILQGKPIELSKDGIWNGGFYLWRCGVCTDLEKGLAMAEEMLAKGEVQEKLREIREKVSI